MARGVSAPTLPGPIDPTTPHDYERERLTRFDVGFVHSEEPQNISPSALSDVNNMLWYDGELQVDTGYGPFGPAVDGQPHVAFQIFLPDGSDQLLLLTTTSLYLLAGGQWQYVNWGGAATLTAAAVAGGATSFTVTNPAAAAFALSANVTLVDGSIWATGAIGVSGNVVSTTVPCPAQGALSGAPVAFVYTPLVLTADAPAGTTVIQVNATTTVGPDLSTLGILLSDGSQFQSSMIPAAATPTTLTLTTPLPEPGALSGAPIAVAARLHGDLNIQPVLTAFPANGWLIISNGVDPIFYYTNGVAAQLPGLPDGTTAQAMNVFHECLLIGNLLEGGVEKPQRIRMSDQGDPTFWTPSVFSGRGLAAIYDLLDTEDFILSLNLLGPWLVAYRETTIMRATYLGLPGQTLFWEYMIYGEGAISQGAVAEIGEEHFVVGQQGVYLYNGGYSLTSIGDNIWAQVFSAKGILNPAAKSLVFVQFIEDQDEVWVLLPTGGATLPDLMIRCVLEKNAWYFRTFADQFVSAGIYLPLRETRWIDDTNTWAENNIAWNSRVFLLNAPIVILCAPLQDRTFVYDYTTQADNGQPVEWLLSLKDIGSGNEIRRWDSLVVFGLGNGVTVQYALDPPYEPRTAQSPLQSYTVMTNPDGTPLELNFGVGKSRQRLTFSAASTYLRIQFVGSDPTFALDYAEVWHSFESEY